MEVLRQSPQRLFQLPTPYPLWNRRWQVWKGGYLSGSSRQLRPGAQHPEHTMQDGACVVPWTTTPIGPA